MKRLRSVFLLGLLAAGGCVSKSACDAKTKAAFLAGEQQGRLDATSATSVWVVGNVKTPMVPWTEDLTLAKALIEADYEGPGDPSQIILYRNGHQLARYTSRQLLNGMDVAVAAGDRVEVRP